MPTDEQATPQMIAKAWGMDAMEPLSESVQLPDIWTAYLHVNFLLNELAKRDDEVDRLKAENRRLQLASYRD